ncbi:hypothetical protein U3516DRAFT_759256 [Neocallimastix sp. 'constans']
MQKEIYCNKNQILKCFCNHEECCSKRTAKCLDWINYFNFSDRENYQTYCSETKIEWKHYTERNFREKLYDDLILLWLYMNYMVLRLILAIYAAIIVIKVPE